MVSVIIPNYNHEKFLKQRIESVLSQTFQDFEIILLDDCSTDNSRDIIENYRRHEKVTHIEYNNSNSGSTFKQWVKGIGIARFEFVWIAESDDWCEPSFLETVLDGINRDRECVVSYCQSYCVQDNRIFWKSSHEHLHEILPGNDFVNNFMLTNNAIFNASMALWRRDAFVNVSPDFTGFQYCGDWLFWIELCRQGNVSISGKLLNYFRKHSGDVSGKATVSGDSFVEELGLFQLLYKRKWIGNETLIKVLTQQYIHYKAVRHNLPTEKQKFIESLLFSERSIASKIRNNYTKFYSKYLVKKLADRLTGSEGENIK